MALRTLEVPLLSPMGDAGYLFEAEGPLTLPTQERIWKLARHLEEDSRVTQVQPCMNNLLILTDIEALCDPAFASGILTVWSGLTPGWPEGRLIELEAVYGGEYGQDLPHVCAHTGLTAAEVARIHSDAEYTVFAPGARPGYGYLYGLDPRLFTPRRPIPELRPYNGTITLGGAQPGLSNPSSPGERRSGMTGWHSIGQALDAPVPFDFFQDPPALVSPGDRIRFRIARIEA